MDNSAFSDRGFQIKKLFSYAMIKFSFQCTSFSLFETKLGWCTAIVVDASASSEDS